MIELVIGNSTSQLKNLTTEHMRGLRKVLFYRDTSKRIERTMRDKISGKPIFTAAGKVKTVLIHPTVYLIDKHGVFPTGLLYIVYEYIRSHGVQYRKLDTRVMPNPHTIGLESILPRDHRLPYEPCREQLEAALAASMRHRGIVVAPTGFGKSAIIALIIEKLQVPTLIVVPSLELKNQLTGTLVDIFGSHMVGALNKGKKKYQITVENVDHLNKKIPAKGFDCVIIDEFHRSGSATYRTLNTKCWNSIYYRIGLTATPFRSNDEERLLLESVLSKVIYKIEYKTAIGIGRIVPMETYFIDLPKIQCKATSWQGVYKELVVERKDRNELLCDLIENLYTQSVSALVLVKQIEHGKKLCEILESRGISVPFANGKDGSNKELISKFNASEFPVLIGTSGVLGEGIDTRPCEYVILAGGGKSKNQFMQQVGRGFRVYPGKASCKIIMLRDSSNKWLMEHHRACVKYLAEEFNSVPAKI